MLNTKTNKILLVKNGSRYEEDIVAICQNHGMSVDSIEWEGYDGNIFNQDIVILSGGHSLNVQDHEKQFAGQIELIQKCPVPIIGICLGFELIVEAFGGKLVEMPVNEKAEITVNIIVNDDIFEGIDKIKAFENHKWKVKELPHSLIPLADSNLGTEVIKHITEPIYAFQFHPEESHFDNCGIKLFENIFTKLRIGF